MGILSWIFRTGGRGAEEPYDLPDEPDEFPIEGDPYELILLNDDTHTFEYVIALLGDLFGLSVEEGFALAQEIHERGWAVVFTGTRQEVELKRLQVLACGPDNLMWNSEGPLEVEIHPDLEPE